MKKSQQWIIFLAAWLGWGFDIFDSLLFNYVAPNCVPTLLGMKIGSPAAAIAVPYWTGILTSILLIGWAVGGVVFGMVADRIGRSKTLLLTMLLYALGTAMCAFAPNIWFLLFFRTLVSLGIGGEWAAGAAMVAEAVPEKRRIEAGALLYTSAPFGILLAGAVNKLIAGNLFKDDPSMSWRYVFLCGLAPAALAFVMRFFVKEPERWAEQSANTSPPKISELFSAEWIGATRSGLSMAFVALIAWWSCNAFIPILATNLAVISAKAQQLTDLDTTVLKEGWKSLATDSFTFGGLIGTLMTIPIAKSLGRRQMFAIYLLGSALAIFSTFGLDLPPETRLRMYFFVGLTTFGIFGSFTYYLPELYPTRLRATGAGFCYNIGRIVASAGPFLVGSFAASAKGDIPSILRVLTMIGVVPLVGLCLTPWVLETKGRQLAD
jgi:MFS family permease